MSPLDALAFASRALAGHRRRTALALLGVAIGIAAVVILTALGEGARRYVVAQFSDLGSDLVVVFPGRTETTGTIPGLFGATHDLTLEDARALEHEIAEARRVTPISIGNDTVTFGDRRRQVPVIGATAAFLEVRRLSVVAGSFLPAGPMDRGAGVAVLGSTLARELYKGADPVGSIVRIGDWRMRVIGVLAPRGMHVGMDMDDAVIVPVSTCMRMFDRTSLFRLVIEARAHPDVDRVRARALEILNRRHGEEDVTAWTQDAILSSLSSILVVLTAALGGIAAVSLSVAGIGIMNVMLVSVSERRREIGVLAAIGAARRQVVGIFLAEAVLLSSAGGVAGLLAGGAGVAGLRVLFPEYPAAPPAWALGAAAAVSLVVGVVFGLLPAWRAARLDPVAALAGR